MKTARTPLSSKNVPVQAKKSIPEIISSKEPSPRSGRSGTRMHQILNNFKPGDMSVATNDLKGTPNGIIRLQDVKFSSSFFTNPK